MPTTVGAPVISIIVPSRDRPDRLARCLAALEGQRSSDPAEIVVVDDGSANTAAVEEIADRPGVRLLRQVQAGPAAARNSGARAARGTYLCFTDDDCEPQPDWAERLIAPLRTGAAAVAGLTVNGSPDNAFAEASQLIAAALGTPARNGGGLSFAPSNNLACRADILVLIPFDEGFPAAAGEDRDWCTRLIAAGHSLVSAPEAVVVHRQQLRFGDFWRQQVRYGRGAFRFRRGSGGGLRLESPRFYAGLVGRGFRRGMRTGILVCIAQIATAVGFIAEWKASRAAGAGAGVA
jgi:glycosyltransferase involved in cell wall biosynthesis